jgi:hypothetical protein
LAGHARPTLRCLRDDLGLTVPHAGILLDETGHPVLAQATERLLESMARRRPQLVVLRFAGSEYAADALKLSPLMHLSSGLADS